MDTARKNNFVLVPEPTLEELIADPIIQMIMRSDDQTADDLRCWADRALGPAAE